MKIEDLKDKIEGKIVGFSTINYDNKNPHNVAVEINKIDGDKIIITDNAMNKTLKNIKDNSFVSIVFWNEDGGYRIDGKVDYKTNGKWFNYVKQLETNKKFNPKGVVIVNVKEVVSIS